MKNKIKFYNIILVAFTILTLISINYSYGFGTEDYITGGIHGDDSGQGQSQGVESPNTNPMGDVPGTQQYDNKHPGQGQSGNDGQNDSNKDPMDVYEDNKDKIEDAIHKNDTIYQKPQKNPQTNASDSLDDMMKDADSFVTQGNLQYDQSKLVNFSQNVYNIALTIGTVIAVLMGSILGIKFMMGSAEEKADTKKLLLAYVVGCIIVFGGFGIWKIVTTILSNM